jgi:hypothetical protein
MPVYPSDTMAEYARSDAGTAGRYFTKGFVLMLTYASIRLFSTKSFKPLGTLKYHKSSVQAIAFAHPLASQEGEVLDDEDDDFDTTDRANRARWLIAGSKDNRVSIWSLVDF